MSGASGLRKHGHTSAGDGGTLGAAAPTSLVIPGASSPAQTAEGSAVWDTDDDKLTVGTGAGRKTLVNEGDSISLLGAPTADVSIGSHKLTNVTDPGSPQDAATKAYVDSEVAGAGGLSDQGVATYLDFTVASAPSSPAAGYVRVYAKTGDDMTQKDSSGTETALNSAGGGGGILAISFDVASSNDFTNSTTLVDLNASNNVVTFTAPASGNVLIVLEAMVQPDSGSAAGKVASWGLRESTTIVAGPYEVAFHPVAASSYYVRPSLSIYMTGLTPGNSYTYKWAHKCSSGATNEVVVGGSTDPRVMTVWEAP